MSTAPNRTTRTDTKSANPLDAVLAATTEQIQIYGTRDTITITLDEVRLLIANPTKSGKLPSDCEIMLFMKTCKARGFNPYAKDVFLLGYDTKDGAKFETVVALQAMLKRAEGNPDYEGKEYGVLVWDKESKQTLQIEGDCVPSTLPIVGGWCKVYRRGRKPEYATANLKSYNKGFGHWGVDPNWMIAKCAVAKALRQAFPSDVGDLTIQEEMGAIVQSQTQSRQAGNLSERLAQIAEETVRQQAATPAVTEDHGDAWEPDEEEAAAIEGQLFDTHPDAAEA